MGAGSNLGIGDIGILDGGSATTSQSMGGSRFQSNTGASLDLSSLQSIQGHTIVDGLTGEQAIGFASLVAETAQKSAKEAQVSAQNAVMKSSSNALTGIFKNPVFLAIVGAVIFLFTFLAFKK